MQQGHEAQAVLEDANFMPPDEWDALATHANPRVRRAVASSGATSDVTLRMLAEDADESVATAAKDALDSR